MPEAAENVLRPFRLRKGEKKMPYVIIKMKQGTVKSIYTNTHLCESLNVVTINDTENSSIEDRVDNVAAQYLLEHGGLLCSEVAAPNKSLKIPLCPSDTERLIVCPDPENEESQKKQAAFLAGYLAAYEAINESMANIPHDLDYSIQEYFQKFQDEQLQLYLEACQEMNRGRK